MFRQDKGAFEREKTLPDNTAVYFDQSVGGCIDCKNVILVGGDHHNGLGLVRSFARHGVQPYGLIVNPKGGGFVAKSKYWAFVEELRNDSEIVPFLLGAYRYISNEKTLVIPWSDGAAEAIDTNLDVLSEHFILPSIAGKQGEIVKLMDKAAQIELTEYLGLSMLPSAIVCLPIAQTDSPIEFPVILKPVMSTEGTKADMAICGNAEQYNEAVSHLANRGFQRILVQKYMPQRKEYVVDGAISENAVAFSVVRGIRQWPPDFGTGSFSEYAVDDVTTSFVNEVLGKISGLGYRGPIDFEFFENSEGRFFINEINWRSSGRNFVSPQTGVHAAYMYYCDVVGIPYDGQYVNCVPGYNMNEATDAKHFIKRDISLGEWVCDVRRSGSLSIWDAHDLKPCVSRYTKMVSAFVCRRASL